MSSRLETIGGAPRRCFQSEGSVHLPGCACSNSATSGGANDDGLEAGLDGEVGGGEVPWSVVADNGDNAHGDPVVDTVGACDGDVFVSSITG